MLGYLWIWISMASDNQRAQCFLVRRLKVFWMYTRPFCKLSMAVNLPLGCFTSTKRNKFSINTGDHEWQWGVYEWMGSSLMSIYCQVSSNILCLIIKVLFKVILNLLVFWVFWVLRRITLNTCLVRNVIYWLILHVCQVKNAYLILTIL